MVGVSIFLIYLVVGLFFALVIGLVLTIVISALKLPACPRCGAPTRAAARFCARCGRPLIG